MDFISDLLRNVFIFIDSIVYGFIGSVYELLMDIAATNIFGDNTIMKFAERVYALIAVFMLFRLSFSVLTYIINPDSATDKSAGGGKLIANVLITIVLLISVPWAFRQVLAIQNDILKDNIIGKIILGTSSSLDISTQFDAGDTMAWTTFSAFFYPNETECPDGWDGENGTCKENLNKAQINDIGAGDAYVRVEKSQLVSGIQKSGLITARLPGDAPGETGEYAFEYSSIIATLGGGFIVYILILFCIQIAVRSVKLGVLQLIAPIPIISYIDPKQSKSGMFSKWLKLCGKTFADLFIRLAAIYFAIFIIMEITHGDGMINSLTGQKASGLVQVLIILGALTFAKDLPKFIEEITGIKLDGGFSLNPFKNNAVLGGIAGGVVGAGLGAVGGFAGNLVAGNKMRDAVRGGLKGFASGGMGGIKDKGLKKDTFTRGAKAGVATGTNYANWRAAGSTMRGRMSDRLMSSIGAKTLAEKLDDEIKAYDDMAKFRDDLKSQSNYDTTAGLAGSLASGSAAAASRLYDAYGNLTALGNTYDSGGTKALKQYYDDLVASNASTADITDARIAWEEAQKYSITNGTTAEIQAIKDDMGRYVKENKSVLGNSAYNVGSSSSYSDINAAYAQAKQDSVSTKSSERYRSAKANAAANKQAKANK